MAGAPLGFPYPRDEQSFEDFCRSVVPQLLSSGPLQKYGRRGQNQHGIDLISAEAGEERIAVQCKLRAKSSLTTDALDADIAAADAHFSDLTLFVVATTYPRSAPLQDHIHRINIQRRAKATWPIRLIAWDDFDDALNEDSQLTASVLRQFYCPGVIENMAMELAASMNGSTAIGGLSAFCALGSSGSDATTDFDALINAIFESVRAGCPDEAIRQYQALRREHWAHLDDRLRYRVIANIGNAHYAKDDFSTAAQLYLEARTFQDSLDARRLEARAFAYLGDDERALALATEIQKLDPDHPQAYAIAIPCDPRPYASVLASIPSAIVDDAEVALALSIKATDAEDLDAAETHARAAMDREPHWPQPVLQLSAVLLKRTVASAYVTPPGQFVPTTVQWAQEALDRLTALLDAGHALTPGARGHLLYNRSSAKKLLGDRPGGLADLDEATRLLPDDDAVWATRGASLAFAGDRHEAIRVLRRAMELNARNIGAIACLAQVLLESRVADDSGAAVAILEPALLHATSLGTEQRFQFAHLLFTARLAADPKRYEPPLSPCDSLGGILSSAEMSLLEFLWYQRCETVSLVPGVLDHWARSCINDLSESAREVLGTLLWRAALYDTIVTLFEARVDYARWSMQTALLLTAADRAERYGLALQVGQALRVKDVWEREAVEVETRALLAVEDLDAAAHLLKAWLDRNPEDTECWLRLGIVAARGDHADLLQDAESRLPAPRALPQGLIMVAWRMLQACDLMSADERVEYFYAVWRANRECRDAWAALIGAALAPFQDACPQIDPVVTVGSSNAVKLSDEASHEQRWVVIEECDVDPATGERLATDPGAAELLGREVGDLVSCPGPMFSTSARIVEIRPAWAYRANWCVEQWETRFPDTPLVQRIAVPPISANASRAEVVAALRPVTESAQVHEASVREGLHVVQSRPMSSFQACRLIGKEQIDGLLDVIASEQVPIWSILVSDERSIEDTFQAHHDLFESSDACVADTTSLMILGRLNLLEPVLMRRRVHVPRALFLALEDTLAQQPRAGRLGGWFAARDGEPIIIEASDEYVEWRRAHLEQLRCALESHGSVHDGRSALQVSPERGALMARTIGRVDARAVCLAAALRLPLLSDDMVVDLWLREVGGAMRTSVVGVLEWARHHEILTEDRWAGAIATLHSWEYRFLPVNGCVVVGALREARWQMKKEPAAAMLRFLETCRSEPVILATMFVDAIVRVRRECEPENSMAVMMELVARFKARPDEARIRHAALRMADAAFGMDVVGAAQLKAALSSVVTPTSEYQLKDGILVPKA